MREGGEGSGGSRSAGVNAHVYPAVFRKLSVFKIDFIHAFYGFYGLKLSI